MAKNLVLIDFLFGSVKALIDAAGSAVTTQEASGQLPENPKSPMVASKTKTHLEACRKQVIEFRRKSPEANRTTILRALGRAATDLRDHAPEWYEENMPAAARSAGRKQTFTEEFLIAQAERLRAHITSRYIEQMASRKRPRKITERFLLLGHSFQARSRDEIRTFVPGIDELIDRLLEDRLRFKHRQVRWFLDYPSRLPAGTDRIEFIARSVGLTVSEVLRIADEPWFQKTARAEPWPDQEDEE